MMPAFGAAKKRETKSTLLPGGGGDHAETVEHGEFGKVGRERAQFLLPAEDGEIIARFPDLKRFRPKAFQGAGGMSLATGGT